MPEKDDRPQSGELTRYERNPGELDREAIQRQFKADLEAASGMMSQEARYLIAAANMPGVSPAELDRFHSSVLCSDQPEGIAYLPTKERPLPPMTPQQLAGLLHMAQGTIGDVAYYPEGCHTCSMAQSIHADQIAGV